MDDHNPLVHIVGPKILQNKLLCSFLEKETGLKCTFGTRTGLAHIVENESQQDRLLLWDCLDADFVRLWSDRGIVPYLTLPQCFIALFNVKDGIGMEKVALGLRVRGIFYEDESMKRFHKGVNAILKGELWYPRKFLSEYYLEHEISIRMARRAGKASAGKEKQVLVRITAGPDN
ncbi:MAG: hypothetical protein GY864_07870 [Desulfobacterales bacterium]|nr:hypothetical protein [Desulfobacterales bacterium]